MVLVLVGAPLGNVLDASTRMRTALVSADIVAAEDTRRLARLAKELDLKLMGRVVSYFEGNERRRIPELIDVLKEDRTVVLVTDGGMPSISDPGYRLVRAAIDEDIPITVIPGPSAVTTALAVSGLPCDRFCFEGFLPRRDGEREVTLASLAAEPRTLIFFEAPHRVARTLADIAKAFGADRPAALCRELTKTYEEVHRAPVGELAVWAEDTQPRGEITLVVAGADTTPATPPDEAGLAAAVERRIRAGTERKPAMVEVASMYGIPKRVVYDAVVKARHGTCGGNNSPGSDDHSEEE